MQRRPQTFGRLGFISYAIISAIISYTHRKFNSAALLIYIASYILKE